MPSEGVYQVTALLIDIDYEAYHRAYIQKNDYRHPERIVLTIPRHIKRFYYSDPCIDSFLQNNEVLPQLIFSENAPFCLNPNSEEAMGVFSDDNQEFFKYEMFKSKKGFLNLILPDSLRTIHSYAFMFAEIDTLRIPASVTEIGKKAFLYAKINHIIFEGKWTDNIDLEAFTGLKCEGSIRINDTAPNITQYNELLEAVENKCDKLILAAPGLCDETSPSIGYIRVTQAYYRDGYLSRWNNIRHNEGIIDINTRYIVSVKEYVIPTYTPVKGSEITIYGSDHDRQHNSVIVYETVKSVLEKIDTALKEINATGCTVDELIDRIKNRVK